MTKRECAIIMAHTGICMLEGDDFNIFHKYCEDLLGHPVFTHQFPMYEKEIKERSFEDFKELCACSTVEPHWIPVTERLPENIRPVIVTWCNTDPTSYYQHVVGKRFIGVAHYKSGKWYWYSSTTEDFLAEYGRYDGEEFDEAIEVIAWCEMPEPYKGEQG